jgi:hypothetical protein
MSKKLYPVLFVVDLLKLFFHEESNADPDLEKNLLRFLTKNFVVFALQHTEGRISERYRYFVV